MKNKKVLNAIYCIEPIGFDKLYFNDIFSGKYEDIFLLHTGLYTGQVLDSLSKKDKKVVNDFIDMCNSNLYETM